MSWWENVSESLNVVFIIFFFFKQKTAYEMRISDWSSDVCSSDLSIFDHSRDNCRRHGVFQHRSCRESRNHSEGDGGQRHMARRYRRRNAESGGGSPGKAGSGTALL